MLRTNKEQLVCQSVIGEITSPKEGMNPYHVTPDGEVGIYPGVGGITYNVRIGDHACGLYADHVEPGVSMSNLSKSNGTAAANQALNVFACAGNEARVVSGDAKGAKGRVTGKHGGIEHVLVDFTPKDLEKLVIGDKIQIKAFGCGLEMLDCPEVKVMNLDPALLELLNPKKTKAGLEVPVTHVIPAKIMGSGIGKMHANSGDYDIQLFDKPTVQEYGLEDLRLGDLVAISDADATFGRIYRTGGMVIAIVVHSDCVIAGHGPGAMVIMSSRDGLIKPKISKNANLKNYFNKLSKGSKKK